MPIASACVSSPQYFSNLEITVDSLNIRSIAAKAQFIAAILCFPKPSEKEKQIALFDIELFEMRFRLVDLTECRYPVLWILSDAGSDIRVQMTSCTVNTR